MASHAEDLDALIENRTRHLKEILTALEARNAADADNMDDFFLIIMGFLIYLMQAGFAFLEAGAVRSKNTVNILIKNALDSFFGGVSYWLMGYAFAFGKGNGFIGYTHFAHSGLLETKYSHWFFQFVFAATAATIVSGAVAERCDFMAYMIYSVIITGFIYPVVTHWTWSPEGWLATGRTFQIDGEAVTVTYSDFAGSSVVHMVGGISAFVAAWAMGPASAASIITLGNQWRFGDTQSRWFASLGGFILVFGFFAFNGSSQGSISNPGDGAAIAVAVTNTVLSASGGAFTTMLMNRTKFFGDQKWSFLTTLNGCLTGMVAICAGCNQVRTYLGFITGIMGGVSYMCFSWLVLKLGIDDPVDAAAVHFGGAIVGVLSVPLFSHRHGIVYNWDLKSAYFLVWQLAGGASIFAWVATLSFIMFFSLKKLHILRVPFEYEMKGLDIPKHGETAYPSEAYGHGWGEKGDTLLGLVRDTTKTYLKAMGPNDVKINIAQPKRPSESPEVDAMRNTKNGQVNNGFNGSDDTSGPMTSHL